jgi:hypothetical protein
MSHEALGYTVLIVAWLLLGALGAYAQMQRGGNAFLGLLVTLAFGPIGLLVANYSGGRQCPFCKARGLARGATKCSKCGSAVAGDQVEQGDLRSRMNAWHAEHDRRRPRRD